VSCGCAVFNRRAEAEGSTDRQVCEQCVARDASARELPALDDPATHARMANAARLVEGDVGAIRVALLGAMQATTPAGVCGAIGDALAGLEALEQRQQAHAAAVRALAHNAVVGAAHALGEAAFNLKAPPALWCAERQRGVPDKAALESLRSLATDFVGALDAWEASSE
jgi:hypothetical protein